MRILTVVGIPSISPTPGSIVTSKEEFDETIDVRKKDCVYCANSVMEGPPDRKDTCHVTG